MNFCIHKYFYQNSPLWKRVREEDIADNEYTVALRQTLCHMLLECRNLRLPGRRRHEAIWFYL